MQFTSSQVYELSVTNIKPAGFTFLFCPNSSHLGVEIGGSIDLYRKNQSITK